MTVLQKIQSELKAPKGQFNSFGKYKYRSCEDIVEAAKPVLAKYSASLVMSDEIVMVGERVYVKATATITGDGWKEQSTAYAREPEEKKGMDPSQITGTASSYARKYALNGLLAIDDTKDADTDEHAAHAQHIDQTQGLPYTEEQKELFDFCVEESPLGVYLLKLKNEKVYSALYNSFRQGKKTVSKEKAGQQEKLGNQIYRTILKACQDNDPLAVAENLQDESRIVIALLKKLMPEYWDFINKSLVNARDAA